MKWNQQNEKKKSSKKIVKVHESLSVWYRMDESHTLRLFSMETDVWKMECFTRKNITKECVTKFTETLKQISWTVVNQINEQRRIKNFEESNIAENFI